MQSSSLLKQITIDWFILNQKKIINKHYFFIIVAPATKSYFRSVKNESPKFIQGEMAPKIGKTAKLITMVIKGKFAANNILLTKEQFVLLMNIEEGPQPQSSLVMITERNKGSLTRLVQSLEKKKYVKRKVCEKDSRVNRVEITNKGLELLNQTKPLVSEVFAHIKAGLNEEEKEIAFKVLDQIAANAAEELKNLENSKY